MAATPSTRRVGTVAEVLNRIGSIPIARIRPVPPPGEATEEDVVAIHRKERRLYELVEGVLVEKVMGAYESYLAMVLARLLGNFIEQHALGILLGEAGMLRLSTGLLRIPDLSFVSWGRLPEDRLLAEPVLNLSPDLAVEVISRGNTTEEMDRKLIEYFEAGVALVWYVDPAEKTVTVFTSPEHSTVLHEEEILDGGAVLPGFHLPLHGLFDAPRPRGH